jgi:hypothetical protein
MGLRVVSDSDAYRESAAGHARATHFGSGKALNLLRIRIREFGTKRANRETIEDRARQFDVLAIFSRRVSKEEARFDWKRASSLSSFD